jgi:hypothetical protein
LSMNANDHMSRRSATRFQEKLPPT